VPEACCCAHPSCECLGLFVKDMLLAMPSSCASGMLLLACICRSLARVHLPWCCSRAGSMVLLAGQPCEQGHVALACGGRLTCLVPLLFADDCHVFCKACVVPFLFADDSDDCHVICKACLVPLFYSGATCVLDISTWSMCEMGVRRRYITT